MKLKARVWSPEQGEANGGLRFEYGGVWRWISTVAGIPVMWEGADVVDN